MTPDFHSLISQMATELDHCQQLLMDDRRQRHPLADRARALLAEPEGTDGEVPRIGHILRLAEIIREVDGNHDKGAAALAEAILSHPGIRSAGLTATLAEPEAEGPSASDVTELFYRHMGEGSEVGFENAIAEALSRWGRPAAAPAPETGEVAELVEELEQIAGSLNDDGFFYSSDQLTRAATLLQQQAAPANALPLPAPEGGESQP